MYDTLGDTHNAVEWFERLNMLLPQDPGVLARLGALHARSVPLINFNNKHDIQGSSTA